MTSSSTNSTLTSSTLSKLTSPTKHSVFSGDSPLELLLSAFSPEIHEDDFPPLGVSPSEWAEEKRRKASEMKEKSPQTSAPTETLSDPSMPRLLRSSALISSVENAFSSFLLSLPLNSIEFSVNILSALLYRSLVDANRPNGEKFRKINLNSLAEIFEKTPSCVDPLFTLLESLGFSQSTNSQKENSSAVMEMSSTDRASAEQMAILLEISWKIITKKRNPFTDKINKKHREERGGRGEGGERRERGEMGETKMSTEGFPSPSPASSSTSPFPFPIDWSPQFPLSPGIEKTSNCLFFWNPPNWPSNWTLVPFMMEIGGNFVKFNCVEQAMMCSKAFVFGDDEAFQSILKTSDPKKQKGLGRIVRNFDSKIWDSQGDKWVEKAVYSKFSQNPHFCEALLETGNLILAEASPVDKIWGIGFDPKDAKRQNIKPHQFKGRNKLGEILMRVRETLKRERGQQREGMGEGREGEGEGREGEEGFTRK